MPLYIIHNKVNMGALELKLEILEGKEILSDAEFDLYLKVLQIKINFKDLDFSFVQYKSIMHQLVISNSECELLVTFIGCCGRAQSLAVLITINKKELYLPEESWALKLCDPSTPSI